MPSNAAQRRGSISLNITHRSQISGTEASAFAHYSTSSLACVAKVPPQSPTRDGNKEPCDRGDGECRKPIIRAYQPNDNCKCGKAETAKTGTAASSPAASDPRRWPARPQFCLRSRSCFSLSVAVAQKIAGKARKRPPTSGPQCSAMSPATIVASPPRTKRKTYSYQWPCRSADHFACAVIPQPESNCCAPSATAIHKMSVTLVAPTSENASIIGKRRSCRERERGPRRLAPSTALRD